MGSTLPMPIHNHFKFLTMKNLLMTLLCLFSIITLQAQDTPTPKKAKKEQKIKLAEEETEPLRGKKGQLILPEKGNIGLSVNVVPLFHWLGNSFNANSSNLYASGNRFFNILGSSVIMGRWMTSDKNALRVALGFGHNHLYDVYHYNDQVVDTRTGSVGAYVLNIGAERRGGKGRLQGYYGIDFIVGLRTEGANVYTYGNNFSSSNPNLISTNWGSNIRGNDRVLTQDTKVTVSAGIRPFVGVEYFLAPKISIGAEFGGSFVYSGTFRAKETIELYTGSASSVVREQYTGGGSQFNAYMDNMGGAIFMNFYF